MGFKMKKEVKLEVFEIIEDINFIYLLMSNGGGNPTYPEGFGFPFEGADDHAKLYFKDLNQKDFDLLLQKYEDYQLDIFYDGHKGINEIKRCYNKKDNN